MQLLERLGRTVERVGELVPACIGLSVTRTDQEGTCTLAVSRDEIAVLDAVQYLDGRGTFFAAACDHAGVRTVLSVPIAEDGVQRGTVRVYVGDTAEPDLEEVHTLVEEEARALLADPMSSLTARRLAQRPPVSLRGQGAVNRAIGALTVAQDPDVSAAHDHLDDAALRAGIPIERLALTLVELLDRDG